MLELNLLIKDYNIYTFKRKCVFNHCLTSRDQAKINMLELNLLIKDYNKNTFKRKCVFNHCLTSRGLCHTLKTLSNFSGAVAEWLRCLPST